jgi:hypothetical protein
MSETSQFFIDVVSSMPSNSEWYFHVPPVHKEFFDAIEGIPYETGDIFVKLELKEEYRRKVSAISVNDVHELIQEARVFWEGRKIFEAYDGFVIGTVSKFYDINGTALEKHLGQDILYISSEW